MKRLTLFVLTFLSTRAFAQEYCPRVFKVKDTVYTDPAARYQWYQNGLALPADTNRWTLPKDPTASYTVVAGDALTLEDALKTTKPMYGFSGYGGLPPDWHKQIAKRASCLATLQLDMSIPNGKLPPEIGNFTAVTELSIAWNKLKSLPPEITKLKNLRKLSLGLNLFTAFPPQIFALASLESLDLTQLCEYPTKITSLPPEIAKLPRLTELILARNPPSMLSPVLWTLTGLTRLDLSAMELTTLPPEIGKLNKLSELDLRSNELATLPTEIARLADALSLLYLDQNPIPVEKREFYQRLLPKTKIIWE